MSIDSAASNRSQPDTARDGRESTIRWFAGIGSAVFKLTKYFLRSSYPASVENPGERAAVTAGSVGITPTTADMNVGIVARIGGDVQSAPDTQEIERRRNVVRTLFNDFWNGAHDKPAAFAKRFDQAEDYLNERLATNGEVWRLDNNTRAMLGLPPRSK